MAIYQFGDFELQEENFTLSREGRRVPLEPKALRVLIVLVSRAGRLVDKQFLLDAVWTDTFVEENTLTRTVAVLRRELGDDSRNPSLIETVPTRGYRFIAPVRLLEEHSPRSEPPRQGPDGPPPPQSRDRGLQATEELEPPQAPAAIEPLRPPSTTLRALQSTPGWILVSALLLAALVIGLTIHRHRPSPGPIRSLGVIPLQNLSGDPKEEYFADGMTDELITELAHITSLRVVSRTSAMQERDPHKTLHQIARDLQVDALVEGSIVRSGDKIRITAQLIDTRNDKHLWAGIFEGDHSDILSLQDRVAQEIASQTDAVVTAAADSAAQAARHAKPEAYDNYLRGHFLVERREAVGSVAYFEKAVALDPQYARGWAGLAQGLMGEVETGFALPQDVLARATSAAQHAIALDPNCGEAHTALGIIEADYQWNWQAADRDLLRGIFLSPSDALAQIHYAILLVCLGRPEEAVTVMRHAVQLDPLSFFANRYLGSALYFARHYHESLDALAHADQLQPNSAGSIESWRSSDYEQLKNYDQALAAYLRICSPQEKKLLSEAYARGGSKAFQAAQIKLLQPHSTEQCAPHSLAIAYATLGDVDKTYFWLDRDVDQRCFWVLIIRSDPAFDHIRTDPRYPVLLHRINMFE